MASQDQAPKAVAQETTIQEIEQARDDLARTIDAITDKVRPANVARRATDQLRERVQAQAVDLRQRAQAQAVDLRQRAQAVDPRLAAAAGAAVVVVGVVALVVWRRRR
jgi:hypothetical protein